MKILLIQNPAVSPWTPRRQWEPPSTALATIAAHIDNNDVKVVDAVVWRKKTKPRFIKLLETYKPDVVGFSAMTFQYHTALMFAYLTKEFSSDIINVLGGYHVTLFYDQIGRSPDSKLWDFFIRGEGDFSFGELLDSIKNHGRGLDKILGLSFKKDGHFIHNDPRPLEDLSKIKIPARDKRINKGFHMFFRKADVIETSRGCHHSCNFCSIRKMYGKSFRTFPLDRVFADIEDAYNRGSRHIFFTDDNITLDMDRFEEICEGITRLKLKNLQFTTQASPIGFAKRPDVVKKMVQAGFTSIFLGIENVSAKSLKAMKKPNTVALIRKGVQALQAENVGIIAGIINGLTHDDEESMRENYRFIRDLGITGVMDQIITPYPNIPLREDLINNGYVENTSDFRWYDGYFSNVKTDYFDAPTLNFKRWKIRREIIGMWKPTRADWKHFKIYSYTWVFLFKHLVWLNERLLELVFGVEGRYKLQMRHFLQLNDFKIEIPKHENGAVYHPLYGDNSDPYKDTRISLLKRKLKLH